MKKVNLLMSVFLMVCLMAVNTAYAQNDEYKALMVRMMKAGESAGQTNLKHMTPTFVKMAIEAIGKKHAEMDDSQKTTLATELVEKYLTQQGFEDMAAVMMPYFEKNISLEDMKTHVEVAESERYQNMTKRMTAATEKTTTELMTGMMKFVTGEIPEAITAAECTDSYQKAFKNYYALSGGDKIMDQLMTTLSTLLQQGLQQSGGEDAEKKEKLAGLIDKMFTYMKDNFETFMLNTFIEGDFTEDDLDYYTEISEKHMPVANKVLIVMQEMLGNMDNVMNFTKSLTNGFATWLEGQEY